MAKTVVAMFNSIVEAQRAKQGLVDEGYAAENIRVVSNDAPGTAGTVPGTSESEYVTGSGSGYTSGSGSGYTSGSTTSGSHRTGVMASIKNFFSSLTGADEADQEYYTQGVSRGGAILSVTAPDDRVDALQATLRRYGADVEQGAATGTTAGAGLTGTGTTRETAATGQTRTGNVTEGTSIPIVEEELQVGKRQVNRGGIRVYSHVVETPVQENVNLREERVRVQRNAVDRPASEADFQAFREGEIEVTESAEEAVVSKQARVVEEVTVGKDVTERTEAVTDKVRRTEVEVEEIAPDQAKRKTTSGS
jgi:uncharacterized protein (TIGR02271 family)